MNMWLNKSLPLPPVSSKIWLGEEKAVPGETSSFPLNKTEDVWQIVPICGVTFNKCRAGVKSLSESSVLFDYLGPAGGNHEKSKEWAETGPGSWSEGCNHVWWLIVGSVSVRVLTAWVASASDDLSSLSRVILSRSESAGSRMYDLQVEIMDPPVVILKVLSSLATMRTAGRVATHAISGGGGYLRSLILQHHNYCSLEGKWITAEPEKYSLDKAS